MGTGWAKSPTASAAPPSHSSFRDDVTIETIRELLARHPVVRLLDCGCGDAALLTAIVKSGLPTGRIHYAGLDQDQRRINRAKVKHAGYQKLQLKVRELSDLDGYPAHTFDLIVINNILHEIAVESLPRLLAQLDSLLVRPHGLLSVVDMEALPEEDAFEPWAFMWAAAEVEALLNAGNWSPQHTSHQKRVMAFKVVVSPTEQVNVDGMERYLKLLVMNKIRHLLDSLKEQREGGDDGEEMVHRACRLASLEVSLQQLSRKGKKGKR